MRIEIPLKKKILTPWLTERSITLISGWRGTGKTWFGLSMFDAISRGKSFGPWNTETSVSCLYVDGEMYEGDAQERLRLLKGENSLRKSSLIIYSDSYANSIGIKRANLLSAQWRRDLRALLMDKGIYLLGLDNISSLASGIDENKKEQWDPINQWLIDLRFNSISTILFHHTNKAGDQRGTSGREDNIDISIILHRPHDYRAEEGARFVVKFKKTRDSMRDSGLMQDYEFRLMEINDHIEWSWNSARRKNQLEILRMIDEGIEQIDIAKTLGIDKAYVSRIKSKAIKDGYLSEKGKLTQSGSLLVNSEEKEDEI
jgi:putative DNA primase/helicase